MTTAQPQRGKSQPSSTSPFSSPPFRYLFIGQAASMTGGAIAPVALTLGLIREQGSPSTLSILLIASTVPTLALLLLGGVWADRLPRRLILVTSNLVCAAAQAGTGYMLITGDFRLAVGIALQATFGLSKAFFYPASTGMTQETVDEHHLQSAVAYLSMTRSLSRSIGPLAAGALVVTVGGGWALVFDALTYIVAALLLGKIRSAAPRATSAKSVWRDLAHGFNTVRSRDWIWSTILLFMIANVLQASLLVLGPTLLGVDLRGVVSWSVVVAAIGAGGVVGDLTAIRWRPRRPMVVIRVLSLMFLFLPVLIVLDAPVWTLAAAAAIGGAGGTLADTVWLAAMQMNLEKDLISRVSSYDWMGSQALRPLGLAAAGAVAETAPSTMLVTLTGCLLACALACLLPSGVWKVNESRTATTSPYHQQT